MQVLIIRDGGAAKIPREVADMDAVEALREQGFEVEVVPVKADEAPTQAVETVEYSDGTIVTGPGPLPEQSPAQQDAASQPEA